MSVAAIAATTRLLSDLVPKEQSTGIREFVKTPFPAHHRGLAVSVTAVFERTGVVVATGASDSSYQARLGEIEVEEGAVKLLTPAQATKVGHGLAAWRHLEDSEGGPAWKRAMREFSDRRATRDQREKQDQAAAEARSARPAASTSIKPRRPRAKTATIADTHQPPGAPAPELGGQAASVGDPDCGPAPRSGRSCRCGGRIYRNNTSDLCTRCRQVCPACGESKAPHADRCRRCKHQASLRRQQRRAATSSIAAARAVAARADLETAWQRAADLLPLSSELESTAIELGAGLKGRPVALAQLSSELEGAATELRAGLERLTQGLAAARKGRPISGGDWAAEGEAP